MLLVCQFFKTLKSSIEHIIILKLNTKFLPVRTRQDIFDCDTNIDATQILSASRLVSSVTGFIVQPNKAIVGANAFAHEAGIHQDGVLKHRETYEIMRAEDIGWNANKLVMGKHSGRNAFKVKMQELGVEFENNDMLNATFKSFKELADKKHEKDLRSINIGITIKNILTSSHCHNHLFKRTIACTLAQAVNGAFNLTSTI
jgi:2-isopropylmalate synthase